MSLNVVVWAERVTHPGTFALISPICVHICSVIILFAHFQQEEAFVCSTLDVKMGSTGSLNILDLDKERREKFMFTVPLPWSRISDVERLGPSTSPGQTGKVVLPWATGPW